MCRSNTDLPKEFGSFFHLPHGMPRPQGRIQYPWRLYGSGRDAALAAVRIGIRDYGWKRVILPSYYCVEVAHRLTGHIEVAHYEDSPIASGFSMSTQPDEALLAVEYFGMRAHPEVIGGPVILDRTHAPLAVHRYARAPLFVFGSLRKVAPLADGGFLVAEADLTCSPTDAQDPNEGHVAATRLMHRAMVLKGEYLQGKQVNKSEFLDMYRQGESLIGRGPTAQISPDSRMALAGFDIALAHSRTLENLSHLRQLLEPIPPIASLAPSVSHLVLIARTPDACDAICAALIARNVFPARLWPLHGPEATLHDRDLSARLLALHVDYRYQRGSMTVLAQRIKESLAV